jgi:signal transduction histidine kinase/CheY-like chemotaxis protein
MKSGMLQFLTRMLKPVVVCIVLADMVVLAIYSFLDPSRIVSEVAITTVITAIVSTPVVYWYVQLTETLRRTMLELDEARAAAMRADMAKSEFLANMSHEIRTPMNGVMGMAELLAKSGLNAKQRTFADIILKSGSSLLTIINDILDFSKIDAGQMELDQQPFALGEAIEDVAALVSSKVAEKDLELSVRIDPALPEMFIGDVGRIRQVVTNIVGNAVKFTERGHVFIDVNGTLVEEAAIAAPVYRISFRIEDTGIGIPADKQERVFDKFSQVDYSTTRRHEGTGLGLAISRSLVDLMGGTISVNSVEGEGSVFEVAITLTSHNARAPKRSAPQDISGSRVLIVDDNDVNRAILLEQMAAWRFDAAAVSSGSEALAVVEAAKTQGVPIDCIVLDYHMPNMNGAQVAAALRDMPQAKGIPVVMLTSVDQTEEGRSFMSLGIAAHLTKPARSALLLDTVTQVVSEAASRRYGTWEPSGGIAAARLVGAMPAGGQDKPVQQPAVAAEPVASEPVRQEGVDILIAEDNEVNQIVFTQILASTPWTFAIARNGRDAVRMSQELKPRLILMDVSMPELNGLEATKEIRESEALKGGHTPIIGVTAHALKGDSERCRDAGMDDYMTKPVSPAMLEAKISKFMKPHARMVLAG